MYASRTLRHAFVGVSAACRGRFCCVLAPRGFLPLSARDGARFAAGFAERRCGLPSLGFCEFRTRKQVFYPGARVKSGNPGPNADFRVFRLNDLQTQKLSKSALPELADIGRRSKSICGRTH